MHHTNLVKEPESNSIPFATVSPRIFNNAKNPFSLLKTMLEEDINLKNNQVEEETLFEFPYYYKFYYNALFCLLLSPNWISFKENSVSIQQFLPQKVLYIVMNSTLCIYYLMSLRNNFATKLQDKPAEIFHLFNAFVFTCYPFVMTKIVWWKGTQIREMMQVPRRQYGTIKSWAKGLALLGLALIFLIVPIATITGENPKWFWKIVGMRTLYTFYVSNNKTQLALEFDEISKQYTSLLTFGFILRILIQNLTRFFEMFALLSSVAAYEIALSNVRLYKENKGTSLQILLGRYALAKKNIKRINDVNGIVLLFIYIYAISITSDTLVSVLDERKLSGILTNCQIYIFYLCILVIAAEVHLKMSYMKNKICEKVMMECDSQTLMHVETFFRNCPGDCALTAQNFFSMSYSLLGTSASIFTTYFLVMIQLKAAPPPVPK